MDYYQKLAIIISIGVLIVIALGIVVFLLKKRKKVKDAMEFPNLLEALGGKENVVSISYKGSRLSVLVDNKKNVDKEKIKEQGVETIVISNKKVTMVVGSKKAILMYNYLKEEIELE
jgi:phosphotransferase system IIB component